MAWIHTKETLILKGKLQDKLNSEYNERVRFCDLKNSQLQTTAESMPAEYFRA